MAFHPDRAPVHEPHASRSRARLYRHALQVLRSLPDWRSGHHWYTPVEMVPPLVAPPRRYSELSDSRCAFAAGRVRVWTRSRQPPVRMSRPASPEAYDCDFDWGNRPGFPLARAIVRRFHKTIGRGGAIGLGPLYFYFRRAGLS